MTNLINLPLQGTNEPPLDTDPAMPAENWSPSPRGMNEWLAAIEHLDRATHSFGIENIRRVEAFWSDVEIGFSSAGFVLLLDDDQHWHLQCSIDEDNQPDTVAVTAERVPDGRALPAFNCDPLGGWCRDVDEFNIELIRLQREEDD